MYWCGRNLDTKNICFFLPLANMWKPKQRCKRQRNSLTPALSALIARVSPQLDPSAPLRFLLSFATQQTAAEGVDESNGDGASPVIEGEGIIRLCKELGDSVSGCDLWEIARRIPRSRSTPDCIDVTELCFAIDQAAAPLSVHDRRRGVGSKIPMDENAPLLKYYKGDRFASLFECTNGADVGKEWCEFLTCATSPLPMTLRVHRNERVMVSIANEFLKNDPTVSSVLRPVVPLMPTSVALFGCSHAAYHADSYVEHICRTLHAASAVSFQEVVSALPVIVAGIQPHHTVLDMCAAPGSKTLQALDEMLKNGWNSSAVSSGVMVANEKDRVKATQTLPARLKRYHAPNVICTRCDAVQWPRLLCPTTQGDMYLGERRFDRVICDVPCSGDGTLRKEPSLASSWSAGYVKSLLPTQRALLRRGLDLLETDGILVYSTCSLQPKEDEEVVCAGLELFGDAVELLDVSSILRECGVQLHSFGGLLSPDTTHLRNSALPNSYDGRKVLRVLPHKDDTGGFFIAAFRKLSGPVPVSPPVQIRKLNHWMKGKLWLQVAKEDEVWCNITDFYGIDRNDGDSFHYYGEEEREQGGLQHREDRRGDSKFGLVPVYHLNPNGGPYRRIVLMTLAAARMLFGTRPYKGPGVEIVSAGVRAFEAYDGKFLWDATCRWRAVVESASYLSSIAHARKIVINADHHPQVVKDLLSNGFVWLHEQWRCVLCQDASTTDGDLDKGSSFLRSTNSLKDLLALRDGEGEGMLKVQELLNECVVVGGVLLGLEGGKLAHREGPWWLSGTLSRTKLEVAIDVSLRAFGLLSFLGITSEERACPPDVRDP